MKKIVLFLLVALLGFSMNSEVKNENQYKIEQTTHYGEKVLRISSIQKTNNIGTIEIKDTKNKVILTLENIEIISLPFYNTINIDNITPGNYNINIKTSEKTISQFIIIK
jgi:hypothetical protein